MEDKDHNLDNSKNISSIFQTFIAVTNNTND